MKWEDLRPSDNVEDQRGMTGRGLVLGGGGAITIIVLIIYTLLGGDPAQLQQQLSQNGQAASYTSPKQLSPEDQKLGDFVSRILGDTEDIWTRVFQDMGKEYRDPKLVLFTGHISSGCGFASAASGPFYCPEDEKVYIDLDFDRELRTRFHSSGDFAQAYVIAHEVGHHVQKLLGTSDKVRQLQSRASQKEANQLSVRLELQADFYAGVWAHYAQQYQKILDPGDIEQALPSGKSDR